MKIMNEIKKLEEQLKKKSQKSLFEVLWDVLSLWFKELKKSTHNILWAPKKGKNQISKWLSKFEDKIIEKRR